MKVFVAGATGAIGRFLVPLLLQGGHEVTALVRSEDKARSLQAKGARATLANALDRRELTDAILRAEPEVVVHQLTALARAGNLKKLDDEFVLTNRFRTEVTDTMIAAARKVGARRFVAQSFCGWPFAREGGPVKTEEDPLDPDPPANLSKTLAAIRHVEDAVRGAADLGAVALRYGFFYGPGTGIAKDGVVADLVRKRKLPIVGEGTGVWSFTHVQDAALATVAAMQRGAPGIYNVVDDEPATVATWLPFFAETLGAKPPMKVPVWLGKLFVGDAGVSMMTRSRGGSNAKAKRELGWKPVWPSWRRGFVEGLG